MTGAPDGFEFVWLPLFEQTAKKLLGDEDRRALEQVLLADPSGGALIRRTGGFRKLRFARAGGGKSGGFRVIYYLDADCSRFYMLMVYPKSMKDDLTAGEENDLRQIAAAIKDEDC